MEAVIAKLNGACVVCGDRIAREEDLVIEADGVTLHEGCKNAFIEQRTAKSLFALVAHPDFRQLVVVGEEGEEEWKITMWGPGRLDTYTGPTVEKVLASWRQRTID